MIKKFQAILDKIIYSERGFQERSFLVLTTAASVAIFLVLIGDILTGENTIECAVLATVLLFTPPVTSYTIKHNKVQLGAIIVSICVTCIILPIAFFFGGGITGGSVIWFAFTYLYIGLVLSGAFRTVMMCILTFIVIAEYTLSYLYPGITTSHSRLMWHVDSCISVLLVGSVITVMVIFQSRLFMRENQKARDQAREIEEMNKAQNRFFSSMSHEIRTPINTIIGLNEMILREDISDEVAEDARNIKAASNILLSLINDILDVSKMHSGKMDIVRSQYDVGVMLSEIVNMIWVKADEKGLKFTVNVDPNMPTGLYSD